MREAPKPNIRRIDSLTPKKETTRLDQLSRHRNQLHAVHAGYVTSLASAKSLLAHLENPTPWREKLSRLNTKIQKEMKEVRKEGTDTLFFIVLEQMRLAEEIREEVRRRNPDAMSDVEVYSRELGDALTTYGFAEATCLHLVKRLPKKEQGEWAEAMEYTNRYVRRLISRCPETGVQHVIRKLEKGKKYWERNAKKIADWLDTDR